MFFKLFNKMKDPITNAIKKILGSKDNRIMAVIKSNGVEDIHIAKKEILVDKQLIEGGKDSVVFIINLSNKRESYNEILKKTKNYFSNDVLVRSISNPNYYYYPINEKNNHKRILSITRDILESIFDYGEKTDFGVTTFRL